MDKVFISILDMSDYDDVLPSNATVTAPLQTIRSIKVINGGNPGDYLLLHHQLLH